jgi:ligand-binding SRPBCC domain-containing protein
MKIFISTRIEKNYRDVFALFNEKLFKALKPPLVNLEVERFDGCKKGDEVHLKISPLHLKTERWISHIVDFHDDSEQIYFIDIGVVIPFPLKSWRHIHRIERVGENKCNVIDDIDFTSGNAILDRFLYPVFFMMFKLRGPIYKRELS